MQIISNLWIQVVRPSIISIRFRFVDHYHHTVHWLIGRKKPTKMPVFFPFYLYHLYNNCDPVLVFTCNGTKADSKRSAQQTILRGGFKQINAAEPINLSIQYAPGSIVWIVGIFEGLTIWGFIPAWFATALVKSQHLHGRQQSIPCAIHGMDSTRPMLDPHYMPVW